MSFAFNTRSSLWEEVERAEEATGLEFQDSIDRVVRDSYLPPNVPAAFRSGSVYADNELVLGDRFFYLPSSQKLNAVIHEGIHALDHDDRLIPEIENLGASESFLAEVDSALEGPLHEKEGMTQRLANAFDPSDGGRYFYPYETLKTDSALRSQGFDVESELVDDIINEKKNILDAYREYEFELGNDLYLEHGSIGDFEYALAVEGPEAELYGEDLALGYLERLYGELEAGMLPDDSPV